MVTQKIVVPGFQFCGIHSGIKADPKKKDLSVIYSEEPQTLVDGVFTRNKVCAAPVDVCRKVIKKGKAQLVIINSGIANACTGSQGMKDAIDIQKFAAHTFSIPQNRVCVSSTGKIGDFLPVQKILTGITKAHHEIHPKGFMDATAGIMTTDQYPKYGVIKGKLDGKAYTLAVMTKGAGMLRPNMATMLAYVMTDLHFHLPVMKKIFRDAVDLTFNRVTVDGDTSTNDTVLMLANGRAGNKPFTMTSKAAQTIQKQLITLLTDMARQITLDGEGATKCCKVVIEGAKTQAQAKQIAYAIGNSPLVKTALFGCDPNWGRIMAAVGYSGAQIKQDKIDIKIGRFWLVKNGVAFTKTALPDVVSYMKSNRDLDMYVQCRQGAGQFFVYMSDLTYDYINLNAEYHT